MSDDAVTGPIITVSSPDVPATPAHEDGFNLLACALSMGALTFAATSTPIFASLAVALAATSLTLSILGLATGRRYPWAGYIGATASATAALMSALHLMS